MKTLKGMDTIVITGWFRKRYWLVLPHEGVYELPVTTVKQVLKGVNNAGTKA